MFDIDAPVRSQWVGENPRGNRIDIQYEPGAKITTEPERYVEDWWMALDLRVREAVARLFVDVGLLGSGPPEVEILTNRKFAFETIVKLRTTGPKAARGSPLETLVAELQGDQPVPYELPLEWFGLDGTVLTGSDWAVVRSDGVAEFSGRLTLKSSDSDHALIGCLVGGVADLVSPVPFDPTKPLPRPSSRALAIDDWIKGDVSDHLPLLLNVTFDSSKGAQPWAPRRYIEQDRGFWKYARLTQGQFVAVGTAYVKAGKPYSPIERVVLSIYEMRPNGR
jgi:hypothetical protein